MFPFCQVCGEVAVDTHEIARGPSRVRAQGERCCLLHLCRPCHEQMGDYRVWPIDRQLELKKRGDPDGHDEDRCSTIHGRRT